MANRNSIIQQEQALRDRLVRMGTQARQERVDWDRSLEDFVSATQHPRMTWTPHMAALLAGVDDPCSPLSLLKGQESAVVCLIYEYAIGFVFENWRALQTPKYKKFVRNTLPAKYVGCTNIAQRSLVDKVNALCEDKLVVNRPSIMPGAVFTGTRRIAQCAFTRCGTICFPEPTGVDVNMLPFIMGDKTSLPDELQVYYDPLVGACPVSPSELGKVCYLSITERIVGQGCTQRRGGLHIEAPLHQPPPNSGRFHPGITVRARWGHGYMGGDRMVGGIFMASNVAGSCNIYDSLIMDQRTTDPQGGCEHLRPLLNAPYPIKANELIWMTDRTPHEAIPQRSTEYRQFFRLVTSDVNVWHSQHCTANPKVPLPDNVLVIHANRFKTEHEDQKKEARAD